MAWASEGGRVVGKGWGVGGGGTGAAGGAANAVGEEIRSSGGEAGAHADDSADWDGAARLVQTAIDELGGLDVLVNNAGFVRDRMVVGDAPADRAVRGAGNRDAICYRRLAPRRCCR